MLDYGYGDPVERWQAEREDEEFERRAWILHGRCPVCGGSGVRCCTFGADVPPDEETA